MATYDRALRSLAERINIKSVKTICKQITVQAVHRIAVYYADGRAAHSIATLIQHRGEITHTVEVFYDGLFDKKSIEHNIHLDDYEAYAKALQKAHFDSLGDMPDHDLSSNTVWCVERASAGLYHMVVMSPEVTSVPYVTISKAVKTHMPEAIREVPVR